MNLPLYPIINTGESVNTPGNYSPQQDWGGYVCAIQFTNKGTNSIATIKYGNSLIELEPKQTHSIDCPLYGYDITVYTFRFKIQDSESEEARVDLVNISIQKYAE